MDTENLSPSDKFPLSQPSIEIGKATLGAIIGIILGGPIGAIAGAVTPPSLSLLYQVASNAYERKRQRLIDITECAIKSSKSDINDILNKLSDDTNLTDDFLTLLNIAINSDKYLDDFFKELIAEILRNNTTENNDRLIALGYAVSDLRSIHIKVLLAIEKAGGILSSENIASEVRLSEIELRYTVRDLELRGMIKDIDIVPIEWELRELGSALVNFIKRHKEE